MRPGRFNAGWRLALLAAVLGLPAAGAEERVAVPAGTPVREVASPLGRVLWTVEAAAELPVLDRSGEWVRVAEGERSGWVELTTAPAAEVGRQEDGGDPVADRLLAAARDGLGGQLRELSWGRFAVLTDLPEHPLLAVGERIAAELPALHARRHGFAEPAPTGAVAEGLPAAPAPLLVAPPLGTLVLFAREADYRAYLAATAGGER
ncbi:MAG TPA: hypothetical protein VHM02_09290, partial [Thermoanaerobaculia bacterium]|nr:hypothetical protein [Thermoanaerobaculia bacterium]